MSSTRIAIAVLAVIAAGAIGYHRYQQSLLSPFNIGAVGPGMRFSDADDEAQRELKHSFTCKPVGGGVQLCRLVTDGPAGVLEQVVDKSGRVAVIRFLISDSSITSGDFGRRQAATWSHVHPEDIEPSDTSMTDWGTWKTPDGHWTAEIAWRRRGIASPSMMKSTDERRLEEIGKSSPAALYTIAERGLLDRRDSARVASLAPAPAAERVDEQPSDANDAANAAVASVASLPRCAPVGAPMPIGGDGASNAMEPALWTVAQQAIARAYPGMQLVAGTNGTSLANSTGAEQIVLWPNASTASGDLYAFAVNFPQRAREASSRASSFDVDNQCRENSTILVAHVDPATHTVSELHRISVDDESLGNAVGHLDFVPTADSPPRLIVEYLASYGTADWYGQVRWNELIAADSVRIMSRSPTSYGTKLPGGTTDGSPLVPDNANPDDPYGLSYAPGTTLKFSTINLGPRTPVRHVALSTGNGALPNGWALLAQLVGSAAP